MTDLIKMSPSEFVAFLKKNGIRKFCFVYDAKDGKIVASHDKLEPIAKFMNEDTRDFDEHEGVFFQLSREYDTLLGAFVHRTCRGQAAGGVRYWSYNTVEDFMRDGMRLGKGMTLKNALAGLWWGGGKGVMVVNPSFDKSDPKIRQSIYKEYGEFLTSIKGCYVTAEDVGTSEEDMLNVFRNTRFTTCIPQNVGGSGNPSAPTARGVVSGMEAALAFANMGTIAEKTIVIQGMGHVAQPLVGYLFERGAKKVIGSDIDKESLRLASEKFKNFNFEPRLTTYGDNAILKEDCDIVAPCATGAVLNPQTIPLIKAKIICGAANNQLEDHDRDDEAIFARNIIYVPDFLTNRMGIVNCADESYGYVNNDPAFERHLERDWKHGIFKVTLEVLDLSKKENVSPSRVAIRLADKLSRQNHPITGHRGALIIKSLIENGWSSQ